MVLLVVLMAAAVLVACGKDKVNPEDPTKDVSIYKSKSGFDTVNDPLSWEAINKFPVVHDGMTIEEGRNLVVDFFRYCKTAVWIPSEDYGYKIHSDSDPDEEIQNITGGVKYGGLPYISVSSGNIYRLLDYIDPETGVGDMKTMGAKKTLFGNQCSFGSYVGIGRVINSANYSWTKAMTVSAGFVKVGDYVYDTATKEYKNGGYNTVQILEDNGVEFIGDDKKNVKLESLEAMCKCYAGLKKGDVIVYFTTAGHVVMISEDAHVEYRADGTIDPQKSYVKVIDQTPGHSEMTNAAGDTFAYEKNVDAKWTFEKLAIGKYIPFTFGEWQGTDPIESSKTEIDYKDETISLNKIPNIKINSNYGITDAYVSIYNANGVEVYKIAVRSTTTSVKEVKLVTEGYHVDIWGKEENLKPAEYEYTVKISAQLSTGERPVLWEGKLVE